TIALVPMDEMRRGVDVNVEAACFQKCAAESRCRSFAIGSGNVDDRRQLQMRIAELFQKTADAVEGKVKALWMQLHKPLDCGGGFFCHDQAALPFASVFLPSGVSLLAGCLVMTLSRRAIVLFSSRRE